MTWPPLPELAASFDALSDITPSGAASHTTTSSDVKFAQTSCPPPGHKLGEALAHTLLGVSRSAISADSQTNDR